MRLGLAIKHTHNLRHVRDTLVSYNYVASTVNNNIANMILLYTGKKAIISLILSTDIAGVGGFSII